MDEVRTCRMFIAEDDHELRGLLATAFRRDGYEVIEAVDGPDLVDHLVRARQNGRPVNAFDVVVSDFHMPGFSGLNLLASFNRLQWSTPFILISAFVDAHTEQRALQLGAAAVFSKPFDLQDLRRAVLRLFDEGKRPRPAAATGV